MKQQPNTPSKPTAGQVIHWPQLYDSVVRILTLGRERELRRQTVGLAQLRPGHRILDVGCGTGTLVITAVQAEPTIAAQGIDPSGEMIDRARQKANAARAIPYRF